MRNHLNQDRHREEQQKWKEVTELQAEDESKTGLMKPLQHQLIQTNKIHLSSFAVSMTLSFSSFGNEKGANPVKNKSVIV